MKNGLAKKIISPQRSVICYELIPPEKDIGNKTLSAYIQCVAELVTHSPLAIDAINIPELREEKEHRERPQSYISKMDNRDFAKQLQLNLPLAIEYLINHATVYEDQAAQTKWLQQTQHCELSNLILVGGESSKIAYPGPNVIEFATQIKNANDDYLLGGITIPTRANEAQRLLKKSQVGIDFFTSQVIYEADNIKKLLREYADICQQNQQVPKRIFLSFAPISNIKDLKFLEWLGVAFPEETKNYLLETSLGIGWRALKICKQVLQDILAFSEKEKINIPLGLNIEHITQHNFELSWEFIEELGGIYQHYVKHVNNYNK